VLLDPFKEKLHLPSTSIQLRYYQGWYDKIIGKEREASPLLFIEKFDPTKLIRVVVFGEHSGEDNGLITSESRGFIYPMGVKTTHLGVAFGANDKICHTLIQHIKSFEVKISTVHHVKGARLWDELIEDVHVMDVSLGYGNERRDVAP
jgi:hypothetical protein